MCKSDETECLYQSIISDHIVDYIPNPWVIQQWVVLGWLLHEWEECKAKYCSSAKQMWLKEEKGSRREKRVVDLVSAMSGKQVRKLSLMHTFQPLISYLLSWCCSYLYVHTHTSGELTKITKKISPTNNPFLIFFCLHQIIRYEIKWTFILTM